VVGSSAVARLVSRLKICWQQFSSPAQQAALCGPVAVGQPVFGGINLLARVRGRVGRSARCQAGLLRGPEPGHTGLAEDPRQRERWHRIEGPGRHLVVHADRSVVQAGGFQRGADLYVLGLT